VLIVDYYNLAYRCLFAHEKNSQEKIKKSKSQEELTGALREKKEYQWFKYVLINQFKEMIKKFKPQRVVIALDARNTWRKEVFPSYKAHRKAQRDKNIINFEEFFQVFGEFTQELKETFTSFLFLDVDRCEADDIIAVLTKEVLTDVQDITCVTSDCDMIQLLDYKNFYLYDPTKKKMTSSISPKKSLLMKLLIGDKGDNIPAVKHRMGKGTAAKIIREGNLDGFFRTNVPSVKETFERNKVLIDFNHIPFDVRESIKESYTNAKPTKVSGRALYKFFLKHKQINNMEDLDTICDDLLNTLD
jgi:5'-3' exonuclease